MRRLMLLLVLLQVVSCGRPADESLRATAKTSNAAATAAASALEPAITIEDFKTQLQMLASDEFGGREPGTEGGKRTVEYLKQSFAAMGLEPGNRGEWLQTVPVLSVERTNYDSALVVDTGKSKVELVYPDDYVAVTLQQQPEVSLSASDVVFVGYGVNAPERNWNDYAGIDVTGKTVIALVNDPGWGNADPDLFDGRAMTYYGRYTYKYEEAARQGAAAALVVHEPAAAGYPWGAVVTGWTGARHALPLEATSPRQLPVAGWITTDAARKLFAAAGLDFDKLKAASDRPGFKPVPLNARASLTIESTMKRNETANVLALKRGSKRPDEVIVYTAHWDHLGTDTTLQGDQIYNGAIDNGTGVAGLLEIAGKFAAESPERSVLFVAVTLEESGLLGSSWYVAHPAFPLERTVANINLDALPVIGPARDMVVVGFGYSELDDYLAAAVTAQGRQLLPEKHPEGGYYFRSDHFPFALAGVPALWAQSGSDLIEGGVKAGEAMLADYGTHRYHQVTDEYDPSWDFRGIIQDIEALYQVGAMLANETRFPAWAKNSPFRAKRQAMMDAKR